MSKLDTNEKFHNADSKRKLAKCFHLFHRFSENKKAIKRRNKIREEIGYLKKAKLFGEMLSKGLSPTVVTYTVLIHEHAGEGRLELAFIYFSEMMENGILPNVITYNALINGLCKFRKMDEAYRWFSEMQSNGRLPNKYTCTIMINGNCDLGNWNEALRLYKEMLDRGIQPDSCTHSALFKHLRKDYMSFAVQELESIILDDREKAEAIT